MKDDPKIGQAPAFAEALSRNTVAQAAAALQRPSELVTSFERAPVVVHDMIPRPAKWTREGLIKQIQAFEGRLNADQEVGVFLAMAGTPHAFHIESVGFRGTEMITLSGVDPGGKPVQLVQHYTQLNVLLTALPRIHEPARRIGFDLGREGEGGHR